MDEKYTKFARPPKDAIGKIPAGDLKGMSSINPQWRIEALTDLYGMCGDGWYVEILDTREVPMDEGEKALYMTVGLYIKDRQTGEWGKPILGFGGDRVIKSDRRGLHVDEEAFKKCFTDALGKACAMVGIGSAVYRGEADDDKYMRNDYSYQRPAQPRQQTVAKPRQQTVAKPNGNRTGLARLCDLLTECGYTADQFPQVANALRPEVSSLDKLVSEDIDAACEMLADPKGRETLVNIIGASGVEPLNGHAS